MVCHLHQIRLDPSSLRNRLRDELRGLPSTIPGVVGVLAFPLRDGHGNNNKKDQRQATNQLPTQSRSIHLVLPGCDLVVVLCREPLLFDLTLRPVIFADFEKAWSPRISIPTN